MNATDLLADFAQRTGLPPLAFSDAGTARLLVDDTVAVDWQHDEDAQRLHLMISFGPPPEGDTREAFLMRLLAANLLGHQTGGAVFALDATVGDVVLTRTLDLESTDSVALEKALEELLAAAERWSQEVDTSAEPGGAADTSSADGFLRA